MLAALLVAGLFGSPRAIVSPPGTASCPASPETATYVSSARACPALEVSGSADRTGVALDPAYDVSVNPGAFARPAAGAVVSGYAADGRLLFALPIAANGAFHVYVPLAPAALQALARITVATSAARAERIATPPIEPSAEIISLDESRAIVAWNAHAFPAIRVRETPERPPIAAGSGTSTYEQMSVDTRARRISVDFSDGVRSTTRTYAIFGR